LQIIDSAGNTFNGDSNLKGFVTLRPAVNGAQLFLYVVIATKGSILAVSNIYERLLERMAWRKRSSLFTAASERKKKVLYSIGTLDHFHNTFSL
jgi:hypothetical protein